MENGAQFQVKFITRLARVGDSDDFLFHIFSDQEKYEPIIVKISQRPSAMKDIGGSEKLLISLAAKAVEEFLLKEIPPEYYQAESNTLLVQSGWFPNDKDPIEYIDNYDEFYVEKPKRKLGFIP